MGRAARNAQGRVILYADSITQSMRSAMDETERRRTKQIAHNEAHDIVPKTINKRIADVMEGARSMSPKRGKGAGRKVSPLSRWPCRIIPRRLVGCWKRWKSKCLIMRKI